MTLGVLATTVFAAGALVVAPSAAAAAVPRAADDSCPDGMPDAGFEDVTSSNLHAAAINCVVAWGIAQGTTPSTYNPLSPVSRAQMATFLGRLFENAGGQVPATLRDAFADDNGSPHERSVNLLASLGVVSGTGPAMYSPNVPVSRAQMASFLVRLHETRTGEALATGGDAFGDDDGSTHETAINKAAAAGLTGGTGSGYSPLNPIQRDQMASFLGRLLDLLVEQGYASPPDSPEKTRDLDRLVALNEGVDPVAFKAQVEQQAAQRDISVNVLATQLLSETKDSLAASQPPPLPLSSGGGGTVRLGPGKRRGDVFYSPVWRGGWNHGHSGIYYRPDTIIHAPGRGEKSRLGPANDMRVAVGAEKQYVKTGQSIRNKAANYAWNNLRGRDYQWYPYFNKGDWGGALNCSQLVWLAYRDGAGIDLDGDGMSTVWPDDIRDSRLTVTYETLR